jgi:hypothetical protein
LQVVSCPEVLLPCRMFYECKPRARRKNGILKMPSDEKKDSLEKLTENHRSLCGFMGPHERKKGLSLKAHFSMWHLIYYYGKERSQFNYFKKE